MLKKRKQTFKRNPNITLASKILRYSNPTFVVDKMRQKTTNTLLIKILLITYFNQDKGLFDFLKIDRALLESSWNERVSYSVKKLKQIVFSSFFFFLRKEIVKIQWNIYKKNSHNKGIYTSAKLETKDRNHTLTIGFPVFYYAVHNSGEEWPRNYLSEEFHLFF